MTPRQLLKAYFTGRARMLLAHTVTSNRYGRENAEFWQDVINQFDQYLDQQPAKLVDMQKEHYLHGVSFGTFYNIVAPTQTINDMNKELNTIAKGIKQPERLKGMEV